MSSINLPIDIKGPILEAVLEPSPARIEALKKGKLKIPQSIRCNFLLDTGAASTCIDPAIIKKLELSPTGAIPIITPSTNGIPVVCYTYDIQIIIPASYSEAEVLNPEMIMPYIRTISIIEAGLIDDQGISCLIGRDILEQCLFIYNGRVRGFTLSW